MHRKLITFLLLIFTVQKQSTLKSSNSYLLWPALIGLHLGFFIYGMCCGNNYLKDSSEYIDQAGNILKYGTWYCGNMNSPILPQLFSQRPPLYGLFIMLLHFISSSNLIITFMQSLLSLFNIFIGMKIIQSYFPKTLSIRSYFSVGCLFFPSQFIYANLIMPEMLLQTAVMMSVYFMLDYFRNNKPQSLLFYQLSITASLLIKPVFIFFPLLSLVMFLILEKKIMPRLKAFLFHIIPALAILTVSFINYQHSGYFEYSSISRKLMINYTARYSAAHNLGDERALQQVDSVESAASALPTYKEKAISIQTGANAIIKQNANAYIFLTLKGIVNFFIDHSRYDIDSFMGTIPKEDQSGCKNNYQKEGMKGLENYLSSINPVYYVYLLMSMLINIVLFFGLFRFAFIKEIPFYCRLVLLTFISYIALLTGMTGSSRFRVPVFLLIVIVNMVVFSYKKNYLKMKKSTV